MTVNIVFLIPGFLGFESFGDYAYFSERVSMVLRASLGASGKRVVVWPVPIPPTSGLVARQRALCKTLAERAKALAEKYDDDVVVHLVGHSTGGVDAHLLTLERPLKSEDEGASQPDSWSALHEDMPWLRRRFRSVVSLASPHQGTCFANDPVAQWFTSDSIRLSVARLPKAIGRVLPAALDIALQLPGIVKDPDLQLLIWNALRSPGTWAFLHSIGDSRELVDDLRPDRCVGRYAKQGAPLKNVLRRSFVTLAATTPTQRSNILESAKQTIHAAVERRKQSAEAHDRAGAEDAAGPDALFALLLDIVSGRTTHCVENAPLLPGSDEAVKAAYRNPALRVVAPTVPLPDTIDRAVSDGVVNTVRQMIDPTDKDEIAGVVVGDHFDVVGHYDRTFFRVNVDTGEEEPAEQKSGLLHSGSQFRDDQFFELIRRVALAMDPALA